MASVIGATNWPKLREVHRAQADLERAVAEVKRAEAKRDEAVRDARADKVPGRQIAATISVSPARVSQILRARR